MADAELIERAKALLDRLAEVPRFAGSPEEAKARAVSPSRVKMAVPLPYSLLLTSWAASA